MDGVWRADQVSEIHVTKDGLGARKPITVMPVFRATVKRRGDAKALTFMQDGKWVSYTWKQYYDKSIQFAKALLHVGVQPHECINVMGNNRPEAFISAVGAIAAGAISGGLYPSYSIDACRYTSKQCDAVLVVVEEREQLDKYLELVRDGSLPSLKTLVMWKDPVPTDVESSLPIYSFDDFLKLGEDVTDEALEERISAQDPGQCCLLCYSSGTTGAPKALMFSHDNLTWTCACLRVGNNTDHNERFLSYIPIPQVAAHVMEIHYPMLLGCELFFLPPDAFIGERMIEYLRYVRPTMFFSIAKLWEEIMKAIQQDVSNTHGCEKRMTEWAIKHGTKNFNRFLFGGNRRTSLRFRIARRLVLKHIREKFGLDQSRTCFAVGMPIADDVVRFLGGVDIQVFAGYGQSECSGPQTNNDLSHWRIGSVGVAMSCFNTKVDETTGEIACSGRHIFMGYLNDEAATKEKLHDGWMHSGDIGRFDEDGFLWITGRIKELIILSNSEHVAPVPIEEALKEELPALAHAVVVGERRDYLTFLSTLKASKTGELDEVALGVANTIGSSAKTAEEAAACPKFQAYVREGMERVNAVAKNDDHLLKDFTILPGGFSIEKGDLTSWFKVKRSEVASKYEKEIEAMYTKLAASTPADSA